MKKSMIHFLLFALPITSFCQKTNDTVPDIKTGYMIKSKNQKTAAWVLLGGGTALIGVGFLIGDNKNSTFDDAATGAVLGGIGFLSAIGSIPLFIASGKNKRKAMSMSFKNEMIPQLQKGSFVNRQVPSLSFKISL